MAAPLLETLSDLGARYGRVGEGDRALATAGTVVSGYVAMASLAAAQKVNYAGALTNYANMLVTSGLGEAAMTPARAAVDLMRDVADRQEAKRL